MCINEKWADKNAYGSIFMSHTVAPQDLCIVVTLMLDVPGTTSFMQGFWLLIGFGSYKIFSSATFKARASRFVLLYFLSK